MGFRYLAVSHCSSSELWILDITSGAVIQLANQSAIIQASCMRVAIGCWLLTTRLHICMLCLHGPLLHLLIAQKVYRFNCLEIPTNPLQLEMGLCDAALTSADGLHVACRAFGGYRVAAPS